MVLTSNNNSARLDTENQAPLVEHRKPHSRLHETLQQNRRARVRAIGNVPKYNVEKSKRKKTLSTVVQMVAPSVTRTSVPAVPSSSTTPAASQSTPASVPTSTPANLTKVPVRLPRRLPRFEHISVSDAAIAAVDPTLVGTEVEFITECIPAIAPAMIKVIAGAEIDLTPCAGGRLPHELDVTLKCPTSEPPTHLLAVYSMKGTQAAAVPTNVKVYPAHSIVIAANCARFPPFKPSSDTATDETHHRLPVVPMCLPSADMYPLLMHYLYTKNTEVLFNSPQLSPVPVPTSILSHPTTNNIAAFANHLAQRFTSQALLTHIHRVHGLWQNAMTLGVFDMALTEAFDLLWEILLMALSISTGQLQNMLPVQLS